MNLVMWGILWGIAGWLIGILLFFAGGVLLKPLLSAEKRNSIASYYDKIAMKLIKRAALVERGTKYDIYKTEHDAEKNADKFELGDSTVHVSNETGLLSTLHKQPFGLVASPEEDIAAYVSPEVCELGEVETRRNEQGEHVDQDGDYVDSVTLDGVRPLVQVREYARRMIPESRSLWDLDETEELYKQSQRLFGESKNVQLMILIIAYGGSMLLTWLILTNAGGTVPTGVEVPGV